MLSTLRSFRRGKPAEMIRQGELLSEVGCVVVNDPEDKDIWRTDLKIVLALKGPTASRNAFINGKACPSGIQYLLKRTDRFAGGFHTVAFNPSDHDLIRGEPRGRRDFLNSVISAEETSYLETLKRYQKIIEQRNSLLKTGDLRQAASLEVFSESLDDAAAFLTHRRLEWLKRLSEKLNSALEKIAPSQAQLRVVYDCEWLGENNKKSPENKQLGQQYFAGQGVVPPLEELKKEFRIRRLALGKAEWFAKSTLLGPHRDDLLIYLGDRLLKTTGSQGEVRSAILALKLCEIELFTERTGLRPVLLLDDFSSELDRERREFLLRFVSETKLQVFVTATERVPAEGRHFEVHAGEILSDQSKDGEIIQDDEWRLTST